MKWRDKTALLSSEEGAFSKKGTSRLNLPQKPRKRKSSSKHENNIATACVLFQCVHKGSCIKARCAKSPTRNEACISSHSRSTATLLRSLQRARRRRFSSGRTIAFSGRLISWNPCRREDLSCSDNFGKSAVPSRPTLQWRGGRKPCPFWCEPSSTLHNLIQSSFAP